MSLVTVKDISDVMFKWAPASLAATWDSVGLQIGSLNKSVKRVGIALDADRPVLQRIQNGHYDAVIVHHPIFYKPLRKLDCDDEIGQIIQVFIKADCSLLAYHTNLDAAEGGVNDCFVQKYGFDPKEGQPIVDGFGKWFECEKDISELFQVMPGELSGDAVKKKIKRIGFGCGSGHGLIPAVKQLKLDCFITGELTYHDKVSCEMHHIAAITVGHRESEVLVLPQIKQKLEFAFSEVTFEIISGKPS